MSTLSIDCKFPRHTKIAPLTDAAFRLHLSALAYCREHETDGFVPESEVSTLTKHQNKKPLFKELEDARGAREDSRPLWSRSDRGKVAGWQIHGYLEWNESHAILEAKRERERVRIRDTRGAHVGANAGANRQPTLFQQNGNNEPTLPPRTDSGAPAPTRAGAPPLQVSKSKQDPDLSGNPDGDSNRARGGRGSTLPTGWAPTEADIAFAAKRGWDVGRIADEAVQFASHHTAKGTISKSWAASWITWVMQGLRFEKKDRASGAQRMSRPGPARAVQPAPPPVTDEDAPTVIR